jgi:cytochrome b6-f complex iron-sulfur subunit
MKRRRFLSGVGLGWLGAGWLGTGWLGTGWLGTGWLGTGATALMAGLTGCFGQSDPKAGFRKFAPVADIKAAESMLAEYFATDPLVVVNYPSSEPGSDAPFSAVNATCSHQGCVLKWQPAKKALVCPCHGSTFGADGKVLQGPATRALATYPVLIDGKDVWVKAK